MLGVVAVLSAAFTMRAYSPGGYHSDGLFQLAQALGEEPWNDWHPIVMSVLWKVLIDSTGSIASLMYLQVALTWLASVGLGLLVYDVTRRRPLSLVTTVIPLLPWVANVLGMLWKDVHMMTALFLCVVLVLWAARIGGAAAGTGRARLRSVLVWVLLGLAALALVYGVLVRKNAVFAALPLVWLMLTVAVPQMSRVPRLGGLLRSWKRAAVALVAGMLLLVLGVQLAGKLVDASVGGAERTGQITQVMLDDILFTITADEIDALDIPAELKQKFHASQAVCPPDGGPEGDGHLTDAYWRCYGMGENGGYTRLAYDEEIRALWFDWVPSHLGRYVEYRFTTFVRFLFATDYKIQIVNKENPYGLVRDHPQAHVAMTDYTNRFVEDLPWTFDAWLWTALLGTALYLGVRRTRLFSRSVIALTTSGLFYMLGYIPLVPANNYRYIYWPVVACLAAWALLGAERSLRARPVPSPEPQSAPTTVRSAGRHESEEE